MSFFPSSLPDAYDLMQPNEPLSLPDLFLTSAFIKYVVWDYRFWLSAPCSKGKTLTVPLCPTEYRAQQSGPLIMEPEYEQELVYLWFHIIPTSACWLSICGLPCLLSLNPCKQILVQCLLISSYHLLDRMLCCYRSQETAAEMCWWCFGCFSRKHRCSEHLSRILKYKNVLPLKFIKEMEK